MRFRRRPTETELLARYWNDLVAGEPPATDDPVETQIDPTIVRTIGRLTASDDAQPPDPAFFARLEQTLMDTAQHLQPVWQPLPTPVAPNPNGHRMPAPVVRGPGSGVRRNRSPWVYASLAIALLLVLSAIGSYVIPGAPGDRFFGNDNGQHNVIPAASQVASPIPDVPMYRNDPTRTGVMPGPGPIGAPAPFWTKKLGAGLDTTLAVMDGTVYGMGDDGVVHALDALTGTERWSVPLGSGSSHVTASDGTVYVSPPDGTLSALDAATGAERWRYTVGGFSWPTALVDGVLYGGADNGVAYALDAATGAEHWRVQLSTATLRGPAVSDGVLYYGIDDGRLLALDAASGSTLWSYDTGLQIVVVPTVVDGLVYTSPRVENTGPGAIVAVDAATGAEVWRSEPDGALYCSSVSITGGIAYAYCDTGTTYAFDAHTGAIQWQSELGSRTALSATQALAGATLYESIDEHTIRAVDIADGSELWRYEADGWLGQFSITGGVIYFGTTVGTIYALGGMDDPNAPAGLATPIPAPLADASPSPVAASPVAFMGNVTASDPAFSFLLNIDADGNRYFADRASDRLAKVAPDGTTQFIIGGHDGPGALFEPYSAVVDADGNLYVGNVQRDAIGKFDAAGNFLLEFGSTGTGDGQFREGAFVYAIDQQGRLWAADFGNSRLQVFDADGTFLFTVSGFGTADGQIIQPNQLALDAEGNVYVAECGNHRISKFDATGAFITSWDHDFKCLGGVNVDQEHGLVYALDADNSRIQVFDTDGNFIAMWGSPDDPDGPLVAPLYISFDGNGNIFVADIQTGQTSQYQLLPPLWPAGAPTA